MSKILKLNESGKEFVISNYKTTIGRKNCDIVLDDTQVSGHHADIILEGNHIYISDMGSTNGTFLNGKKVDSHKNIELKASDNIRVGRLSFQILDQKLELNPHPSITNVELEKSPRIEKEEEMTRTEYAKLNMGTFHYGGNSKDLLKIVFRNMIMSLVTAGLYAPFAKTNIRKYIWSRCYLDGKNFKYTGTGKELFIAYIKVLVLYFAFVFGLEQIKTEDPRSIALLNLLSIAAIVFLYIRSLYGSHRYMMNRTSFRKVNFFMSHKGSGKYTIEMLIGAILCLITLGFYYPVFKCRLDKIVWSNSRYGNYKFRYTAKPKHYYPVILRGLVFSFLTLGLYLPYYVAEMHRMKVAHIKLETASFQSYVTGRGLFLLAIKSFIYNILTLGLASPWIFSMNLKYFAENLEMVGVINTDDLIQAPKIDEGALLDQFMDFFDADGI
jgi:uncharacterized membrane protein YjgN (DUF898 family)